MFFLSLENGISHSSKFDEVKASLIPLSSFQVKYEIFLQVE